MGLGHFLSGVGEAVGNVAKAGAWVARPDHWDDIAEGVGKAGEYALEHPGKVWDTGFEVGRAMAKDQLTPTNLAINAGLLAATVATGGLAGGALAAKLGMGAKSLEAGVTAAKGIETAGEIVKGVKTADTAIDVAKGVETGVKGVEAGTKASKIAQTADKVLGLEPGRVGKTVSNVLNPLENSRFGMAAARENAAGRILEAGGEAPSLARQATAALVQGGGRGAGGPSQLAGMGDRVYQAQRMVARGEGAQKRIGQMQSFEHAVGVAADPTKAIEERAATEINKRTHAASYTDTGQTAEGLYSQTPPGQQPGAFATGQAPSSQPMLALPSGRQGGQMEQAQSPYNTASTATPATPSGSYSSQGPGGTAFGPPAGGGSPPNNPPPSAGGAPPSNPPGSGPNTNKSQPGGQTMKMPKNKGAWHPTGQHFWEGPRSQWAGGIKANYDWRPVDPLRKIETPSMSQAGKYSRYKGQMQDYKASQGKPQPSGGDAQGPLNDQGAPDNFSPEVPKSGMYSMSAGQQPVGALNPGQPRSYLDTASPMYQQGSRTSRRGEPMQALGTGDNMIEADSWEKRTGPGMSVGAQQNIHAELGDATNLSAMAGAGIGRPNMIGQTPGQRTVGRRSAGLNPAWKPLSQPGI